MNPISNTYLRLFEPDGSWIERPDYMVLAALSDPDPITMEHVYASMLKEDELNPDTDEDGLSRFGADTKKRYVDKNVKQRVLAGSVLLELCRLAQVLGKPPSVNAARRLVAYQDRINGNTSLEVSIRREVEISFSKYRSTAHLQAVAVYEPTLIYELEGDEVATLRFLGLARAFEGFVCANVVSHSFSWSPIKIPQSIQKVNTISFSPLTKQEVMISEVP